MVRPQPGHAETWGAKCRSPSDCSTSIQDGRTITLTETHGSDSVFEGWSPGDCARSPTCKLRVTAGITVVGIDNGFGAACAVARVLGG